MKNGLKGVIASIAPEILGVARIKFDSFKKLGIGEGNLNYVFKIQNRKFICRINIDKSLPNKSRNEYFALKLVENLKIAPKVFYLHKADTHYPKDFIILEFIEGKPFRMKKRTYSQKQIKNLAVILAKLHNNKISKMQKMNYSYQYYLHEGLNLVKSINKYTNNKFNSELKQIYKSVKQFIPKKENHKFGIIHGDIAPQNIIETENGLELIDWESFRTADPANDIGKVLADLGLKGKLLGIFLKEYGKIRKDETILARAKIYAVLQRYVYVLWEIVRAFEMINKELPAEYLRKTSAKAHINEAKYQYKQLKKLIAVPKIDNLFLGINSQAES